MNKNLKNGMRVMTFWATVLGIFGGFCWYFGEHQDYLRAKEARATLDKMIQQSDSAEPGDYFKQLSASWPQIANLIHYVTISKASLTVQPNADGRFDLILMGGGLGDGQHSVDLGEVGRKKSEECAAALVWACGYQIRNVRSIQLEFSDIDANASSAEFHVEVMPDASFDKRWQPPRESGKWSNDLQDATLMALLSEKMRVTIDTASGKQWVSHPGN